MSLYDSAAFRQSHNILPMLLQMKMMGRGRTPTPGASPMGDPTQAMQGTDFPRLMEQIRLGNQVQMSPDILSRLGVMGGMGG